MTTQVLRRYEKGGGVNQSSHGAPRLRPCHSHDWRLANIHTNRYSEETKKAVESINAVMAHLGSAALELLTDRDKLLMLVAGGSALAIGVYSARCVHAIKWGGGRGGGATSCSCWWRAAARSPSASTARGAVPGGVFDGRPRGQAAQAGRPIAAPTTHRRPSRTHPQRGRARRGPRGGAVAGHAQARARDVALFSFRTRPLGAQGAARACESVGGRGREGESVSACAALLAVWPRPLGAQGASMVFTCMRSSVYLRGLAQAPLTIDPGSPQPRLTISPRPRPRPTRLWPTPTPPKPRTNAPPPPARPSPTRLRPTPTPLKPRTNARPHPLSQAKTNEAVAKNFSDIILPEGLHNQVGGGYYNSAISRGWGGAAGGGTSTHRQATVAAGFL